MSLLNGAAIAWKTRQQTTVSLNSTEAEVKAMVPEVEVVRSLTGLWGELVHQRHGGVRVLEECASAIAQDRHGIDSRKCASHKRAQFYAEEATDQGLMWLDFIPGQHNPSNVLTKHVGSVKKYEYKTGVLCGSAPLLYEAATVLVVLVNENETDKNKK